MYEGRGKIVGVRVLPDGKVEQSLQESGKAWGVDVTNVGTLVASPRPDGSLSGEGQGFLQTKDGEVISWRLQGVGWPTGRGLGGSFRGALFFWTASQKLAAANKVVGVFEHEVDETGNLSAKVWEWK